MATMPSVDVATQDFVSVEEYLTTRYEPDCDYVDGRLEERNLGEYDHAMLQSLLAQLFMNNRAAWGVYGLSDWRVNVKPRNYRVPDLTVLRSGTPKESIATHPPLLVIEILSPEDRLNKMVKRCQDYVDFGIEHIWIIDPQKRKAHRVTAHKSEEITSGVFEIPGTPIRLVLSDLLTQLNSF